MHLLGYLRVGLKAQMLVGSKVTQSVEMTAALMVVLWAEKKDIKLADSKVVLMVLQLVG